MLPQAHRKHKAFKNWQNVGNDFFFFIIIVTRASSILTRLIQFSLLNTEDPSMGLGLFLFVIKQITYSPLT